MSPWSIPTVVVPLDGSELAERALAFGVSIAARVNCGLVIVTVPEVYGLDSSWHSGATVDAGAPMVPVDELMSQARAESERYLATVLAALEGHGLQVDTIVANEAPAHAILHAAEDRNAWLIVMGTHGRGGLARWVFGSVADEVLHVVGTPLMVVRADAENLDPGLDHILVGLDGSTESETVLPVVQALALAFGSRVTLAHVMRRAPLAHHPARLQSAEIEHRRRKDAYFARLVERLRVEGVDAGYQILAGEDIAAVLLARAETDDVDLIAITTHRRGRLSRFVLGSVADRVVRSADTPVLVQRLREPD